MNRKSELDCYLYFMWNAWEQGICIRLFGACRGQHIWKMWETCCQKGGEVGGAAILYANLDSRTRQEIVEKAVSHYNPQAAV